MALIPSPAVRRAADLLGHLAAQPTRAFTVTELARDLGLPRATCDSLLLGLGSRGLVQRGESLRYELGVACIPLGEAAREAHPAHRAAEAEAENLAKAHAAVVAVTTRCDDSTRVIRVFDFGPPFGLRLRTGDAIALVPPFGASFIAWDDAATVDNWLSRAEPPLTTAEADRYRAALTQVRQRGYSVTVNSGQRPLSVALERLASDLSDTPASGHHADALHTISHSEYLAAEVDRQVMTRLVQLSAPVFEGGRVVASIMMLGPSHDLTAEEIERLGSVIVEASRRASQESNGQGST